MADIKTCTINGKTYCRIIYTDGTRVYSVETKRITNRGRAVIRTITTIGTKRRIDAELEGGMPMLKRFLAEWLAWAEAGGPRGGVFEKDVGLCSNLRFWCTSRKIKSAGLAMLFKSILPGRDKLYPFGRTAYFLDLKNHSHHTNKKRLAWVRETLK